MLKLDKHFTTSDGVGIHYRITVAGADIGNPWLVLLHGFGGDLQAWGEESEQFAAAGFNSLAVDLRGHGLSGRPVGVERYGIDRFVSDIREIVGYEQLVSPILVGHCFGGMISMAYVASNPGIGELVLVDTSYKLPSWGQVMAHHEFIKHMLSKLVDHIPDIEVSSPVNIQKYKGSADYYVPRIVSDILHTSLRSYLTISEKLLEYDGSALLSRINIPTLVIDGEEDSVFPPQCAIDLADRIKHAQLDLIPGANHILVVNNPQDLSREIIKFITG